MDKEKELLEWIKIADEDLKAALFLMKMNPKPLEIICFHCQQSAEKCLKAFLVKNEIVVLKTHNMEMIIKKCIEINNDFRDIKKNAIRLTDYAVELRYPYRLEINEKQMELAIKDANTVKEFVLEKLK